MKLCPQCEFLYEDDQIFCDMDGEGLVYDTRAGVLPAAVTEATRPVLKEFRLRRMVVAVVAGLLLATLLSFAYYASSRSLYSQNRPPELIQPRQIAQGDHSSTQPSASPSQSPINPDAASESAAEELVDKSATPSARTEMVSRGKENTPRSNDSRLMISKRVAPLPQLDPLPQLLPPRRLSAAKPTATQPVNTTSGKQKITETTIETSQKSLIVEVKPAHRNPTKRSKVGAFLKKTGRMLTKPFKH